MKLNLGRFNDNELFVGSVSKIRMGTGAADGRCVNFCLTGQVWNAEAHKNEDKTIPMVYWATESHPDAAQRLSERLQEGTLLAVLAHSSAQREEYMVSSYRIVNQPGEAFVRSCCWTVTDPEGEKEQNIIIGKISNFQEREADARVGARGTFGIRAIDAVEEGGDRQWANITVWKEKYGSDELNKNYDRAVKLFSNKPFAVVVCGRNAPYIKSNGETSNNFTMAWFELLPKFDQEPQPQMQ